ncbi:MAG: hypothetical protein ACHQYQ_01340 [Bacteriovoracales bacterium]
MKSFFTALTALLFLNSSYACPNLSGIYYCVDKDGNYEVEYSQMEDNGVTIFNSKRSEDTQIFEADGIEKPYTGNEDGKEITLGKITAFCKDEKVHLNLFLNEEDSEVDQVKATLSKVEDVIKITAISRLNGQVVETKTIYCVPKV